MVSIDTVPPHDVVFAADITGMSCVLAERARSISHRWAEDLHDTFIAQPSALREESSWSQRLPPTTGVDERRIFPAQPPHVVDREVRVISHMLLTAGRWLATVDASSVPLAYQMALGALAEDAYAVSTQRFPRPAHMHEPSCPLHREADLSPPPPPEEATAPQSGSPVASGSGTHGHASSAQARPPRRRGRRVKR
jgi:hypothetical protein